MVVQIRHPEKLVYPDSDGKPLGENTLQFHWIVALFNAFEGLLDKRDDVFLAGDLFWYPVKGDPTIVTAPDIMIAFGRPKGHRKSYKQWEEKDIGPQVVFEILSPGNTAEELVDKHLFYQQFGVEEYYIYNPHNHHLEISVCSSNGLVDVPQVNGFVSPRLKVRFEASGREPMRLIRPDGEPFRTYLELVAQNQAVQEQAAEDRRKAAEEHRKAAEAHAVKERLAAKLRELGIDPDTV